MSVVLLLESSKDNQTYCLAAFCNASSMMYSDHLHVDEYMAFFENLWESLSNISLPKQIVNVPVPGGNVLSVGSGYFTLDQKICIIVHSFIRSFAGSCPIRILKLCLSSNDAETFDFEGWQNTLLPFLFQLTNVPILLKADTAKDFFPQGDSFKPSSITLSCESLFVSDFLEIVKNLESYNGKLFEQFEGSRKSELVVSVQAEALRRYIRDLRSEAPQLMNFLCQRKGKRYDRNHLFQLLGLLQEQTTFFGALNRKSVVLLGLSALDGKIPDRWEYLGCDVDNIVSYVGQKLTILKRNNISIYHNEMISEIFS